MSKKQTSIDWLVNFFESGVTSREEWLYAKEQAKAMHKEEIMEAQSIAISKADMTNNKGYFDCEQYYKDTYGEV